MTAPGQCRALLCLLGVVFAVGILTLPAQLYTGDPNVWREEARSLVLHGTLHVNPEEEMPLNGLGHYFVLNYANGQWYSKYGIVNSLLNTLPLMAEKLVTGQLPALYSPTRVLFLGVFFVLQSLAIAWVLFLVTGYFTQSVAARVAYVLIAFFATYLWNYLRSTTSEATQLLFLAACFLFFLRWLRRSEPIGQRPKMDIALAWAMLMLLCLTKISSLALLPLFALILARVAIKNHLPHKAWPAFVAWAMAAPIAIIIAAQALVQDIKFGSPFITGYHQLPDPPYPHTMLSATEDFLWGAQGSIFIHFPLLLLALCGAGRFARRYSHEALFLLGCLLITYMLVAPADGPWRGEWAYGPRYFVPILPLLALPALYPLEWMFAHLQTRARGAALGACIAAALFFAAVQMEVNRMDVFFKYRVRDWPEAGEPEAVKAYFTRTNFARIDWDHLRCRGHWEDLPYYAELQRHASPAALEQWKHRVDAEIARSNLYWIDDGVRAH